MATTAVPNVSTAADTPSVAETLAPIVRPLLGDPPPVRMEFWDGTRARADRRASARCNCDHRTPSGGCCGVPTSSAWPGPTSPASSTPTATSSSCRRRCGPPCPRTSGRPSGRCRRRSRPPAASACSAGRCRRRRSRPSSTAVATRPRRDAAAIQHHYDVGNDFYRLVLGPAMTYSCARFVDDTTDLTTAQAFKHDLICRKLGLDAMAAGASSTSGVAGARWPSTPPRHYDVSVVGITISEAQAARARDGSPRPASPTGSRSASRTTATSAARSSTRSPRSACPSTSATATSTATTGCCTARCGPAGRLLNHAISKVGGSKLGSRRSSAATCSPTAS